MLMASRFHQVTRELRVMPSLMGQIPCETWSSHRSAVLLSFTPIKKWFPKWPQGNPDLRNTAFFQFSIAQKGAVEASISEHPLNSRCFCSFQHTIIMSDMVTVSKSLNIVLFKTKSKKRFLLGYEKNKQMIIFVRFFSNKKSLIPV